MKNALYLAWKSLLWHRGRSVTILLSLAITIWLPVTVRLVLDQFRREISERANATPLVLGAKGSRIDLALHALYFDTLPPADTTMAEVESIDRSVNRECRSLCHSVARPISHSVTAGNRRSRDRRNVTGVLRIPAT